MELLKPGSLQHHGDNMLAFLLRAASSYDLVNEDAFTEQEYGDQKPAIYFDILGVYMIVYHQQFANMLQNSVILQSLLIWFVSLAMGGYTAAISFAFSCFSLILMWVLSLSFSILFAFILPSLSWTAVPYISSPW